MARISLTRAVLPKAGLPKAGLPKAGFQYAGLWLACCFLHAPLLGQPLPMGPELQINSYTTDSQQSPAIAHAQDGSFVVVWDGRGSQSIDAQAIHGQRFDANGMRLGLPFQINTYTEGFQSFPDVAIAPSGRFLVVWESQQSAGTDNDQESIQGRLFDSAGQPQGDDMQLNAYTTSRQMVPQVAADAQGRFVVTWHSYGSGGSDNESASVQARQFDSLGQPLGKEFQVNTITTYQQFHADVGSYSDGSFVVVWFNTPSVDGDEDGGIRGRRYASDGVPLGDAFQINTYTTLDQGFPSVALNSADEMVVVWESGGSGASDTFLKSVHGRRYTSSGVPAGSDFQVNIYTTLDQTHANVALAADGGFIVTWDSEGSNGTDDSLTSIQSRAFDSQGIPLGDDLQINTYTLFAQTGNAISLGRDGRFLVVWASGETPDDEFGGIRGQRFVRHALFVDDFETGDTAAWSSTSP